jgi:hypothetical protein
MFSTRSPERLATVLASFVPIHYFPRICDPIVTAQVFSPANVVFSGIGVLLLVSDLERSLNADYHDTGIC